MNIVKRLVTFNPHFKILFVDTMYFVLGVKEELILPLVKSHLTSDERVLAPRRKYNSDTIVNQYLIY